MSSPPPRRRSHASASAAAAAAKGSSHGDHKSPRRSRRDSKWDTERPHSSNRYLENDNTFDRDRKRSRRFHDAAPLEEPPASGKEVQNDVAKKCSDQKVDGLSDGPKRSSDRVDAPRSSSHFQHDERGNTGHGGRSYSRRATDHGRRWDDQKERSNDRIKDKIEDHNLPKKAEKYQSRGHNNKEWRHDGFFQLESEAPPAKRRPAFSEKKIPRESLDHGLPDNCKPALDAAQREERGPQYVRGLDRSDRPFRRADERSSRWEEAASQRREVRQGGYQPRERFGGGA
uniref:Uncharacterized protein n=1 Tax=Ananas comosus var. bracteatus TaxID=296719 RepID=A0A6V7NVH7_ANACO|nr:unnamed protein product [Ananas comosus var. bracteatus]